MRLSGIHQDEGRAIGFEKTAPATRHKRSSSKSTAIGSETAMSIGKLRSWLYWLARLLGDVNAVKRGLAGQRVARRATGRLAGRLLGRLLK